MALSLLFNPVAGAAQAERAVSIIRAVRHHRKTPNASGVGAGTCTRCTSPMRGWHLFIEGDRVIHKAKPYNITSLIDCKSANRELVLMCRGNPA